MITKTLERVKVSELIPYEMNPRVHDEKSVKAIVESMNQCEPLEPIEIDENNVILAGHGRRLAHIERKDEYADCLRYVGMTEEQKTKYRILSNKTQEYSDWDMEKLEAELADLDMRDFDFNFDDIEEGKTGTERKDLSDSVKEQFQIIIDFENEDMLEEAYMALSEEGYTCRTLIL